jgi:hypothetical protein
MEQQRSSSFPIASSAAIYSFTPYSSSSAAAIYSFTPYSSSSSTAAIHSFAPYSGSIGDDLVLRSQSSERLLDLR